jgi:hypothetical protein
MRIAPALALTIAAALSLGACQQQHTPIVPSPAPSATPIFASDDEALAAAEEAYRAFQQTSDQILADGGENPERLEGFATPEAIAVEREGYAELKSKDWRASGHTLIDSVTLESYTVGATPDETRVVVYACVDLSETKLTDAGGTSVVSPDRKSRLPFETSFAYSEDVGRLLLDSKLAWTGADFCQQ